MEVVSCQRHNIEQEKKIEAQIARNYYTNLPMA